MSDNDICACGNADCNKMANKQIRALQLLVGKWLIKPLPCRANTILLLRQASHANLVVASVLSHDKPTGADIESIEDTAVLLVSKSIIEDVSAAIKQIIKNNNSH